MCDLLVGTAKWAWSLFHSSALIGWIGILAELAVAAVIYMEVEHSRQAGFFQKAVEAGSNSERGKIYEAFVRMEGTFDDLEARRQAFLKTIYADKCIRDCCDSQVRLVNELGFSATRRFARTKSFIELFPHGPIFVWTIVGPYVEKRRKDTGPWYARHMLAFVLECIEHALKSRNQENRSNEPFVLRSFDDTQSVEITIPDIVRMQGRLRGLLNENPIQAASNGG